MSSEERDPAATGESSVSIDPAKFAALCAPTSLHSRGLHSFTSQLNLSAFCGIGGARRDCVARVKGVSGGVYGVQGVFVCQTRLKLSRKVDECKPLLHSIQSLPSRSRHRFSTATCYSLGRDVTYP